MPRADTVLTIPLETKPTGIFAELSPVGSSIVENVHIRLDQIGALLFVVKNSEALDLVTQEAIGAIETMVGDCAAMLDVCGPVGVAA